VRINGCKAESKRLLLNIWTNSVLNAKKSARNEQKIRDMKRTLTYSHLLYKIIVLGWTGAQRESRKCWKTISRLIKRGRQFTKGEAAERKMQEW